MFDLETPNAIERELELQSYLIFIAIKMKEKKLWKLKASSALMIMTASIFGGIVLIIVFVEYQQSKSNTKNNLVFNEIEQVKKHIKSSQFDNLNSLHVKHPTIASYRDSYPSYTPLLSIIERWNPDNPDPPAIFQETLQHFNYSNPRERAMAEIFRNEEKPFKIYGIPEFNVVVEKWTDQYLSEQMRTQGSQHVEKSASNHFMFWNARGRSVRNYKPPTEFVKLSFTGSYYTYIYACTHIYLYTH